MPTPSTDSPGSFPTKTGRCEIDGDALRLVEQPGGNVRTMYDGVLRRGPLWRRLGLVVLYLGLFAGLALVVVTAPWTGFVVAAAALALLGVSWYRSRRHGFTDDREIPLDAVDSVVAREGLPMLTRPRFVVRYDDDGERKRRYVLLPSGLYEGTDDAFEAGKRQFERRGIAVEEADGLL